MKHLISYTSSFSRGAVGIALLALLVLANGAYAGEAYCEACQGGGGWDPMAKLDEIGTGNYDDQPQASPKWPEKSRELRWNMSSADGQESEAAASYPEKPIVDTGT